MYSECLPAGPLRARLECVWTMRISTPTVHPVRPDGCIDILYTRDSRASRIDVIGTMTASRSHSLPAGTQLTGLRFLPGKSPVVPPADAIVPLSYMLRIGDLQHRLDDSANPASVLSGWLAASHQPPPCVELALSLLEEGCDLNKAASAANLSVRQFRRRCAQVTGLSPRHLARILRFRRACQMAARATHPDWAGIALDTGYFDQAHLIRDFHEFAGATPMAVFSNTRTSDRV